MNKIASLFLLLIVITTHAQQKVIPLYNGAAPGSENWTWSEQENDSNAWKTKVVYNVSKPTLNVFLPDASAPATGTAVIICPGGGFHALSINSEGYDVANWLTKKGITCFVLKYRLAHTESNDPVQEWTAGLGTREGRAKDSVAILMAIADGKAALTYVRQHAAEYNIKTNQVGMIGFSAGGTVTASSAFNYTAENRPDFVAPVYAYMPPQLMGTVADDAPPMFIVAASDDNLNLAPHSVDLYSKWLAAKKPVELHLYVKGESWLWYAQAKFANRYWIDRFGDWLSIMGFAKGAMSLGSQQTEGMQNMLKDWPNMKRYSDMNKNLKGANGNRIVFMGNSITEGWMRADSAFFTDNNYIDRASAGKPRRRCCCAFARMSLTLNPLRL